MALSPEEFEVVTQQLRQRQQLGLPPPTSKPKKTGLEKVAGAVNSIFPGKQIGESVVKTATNIKNLATGGREKFQQGLNEGNRIDVPALIGDYTQAGLNLGASGIPLAKAKPAFDSVRFARGASDVVTKGAKATALGKNIATGGALGYGIDVTQKLKEGGRDSSVLKPGVGTATGAAIPGGLALAGGVKNVVGRTLAETSGALTGRGYGGHKAFIEAIEEGGNRAKIAKAAMRGGIPPEQIKEEADAALGTLFAKRSDEYQSALKKMGGDTKTYDISPILSKMQTGLEKFKVAVTPDGQLDFSRSPIRFNEKAKKDIQTIVSEMKDFGTKPGDRTVIGLDSLKRAFSDLYTESGEAKKFVTDVSGEVRKVLGQAPGYNEMSEKYAKNTELIKDIQKSLSVGDKKSVDAGYKRLLTIVRGNTDTRMQLLKELDEASGGKLIPMVAGELSRTWLPRGLSRAFTGGAGAVGYMGSGEGAAGTAVIGSVLKALVIAGLTTSPRLAGEMTNALGLSRKYTKPIAKALNSMLLNFQATKGVEQAVNET